MLTILSRIPVWVWPLLLLLLLVGLRATRQRESSIFLIYGLPFLGLLGLNRVLSLTETTTAVIAFSVMYLVGAALGYIGQRRWTIAKTATRISLRGEWVTLAAVMLIFFGNLAAGIVMGAAPALAMTAGFALVFGAVSGLVSGSFIGRALHVAVSPTQAG